MGSKCKGIMGTVVLCTSYPLLISYRLFFTKKTTTMHVFFPQLSILYFNLQSYMDLVFYLSLTLQSCVPFYSKAAQEHTSIYSFHPNETCTNHDEVRLLFLHLFKVVFNHHHMARIWNAFQTCWLCFFFFLITSELCKPPVFGLPLESSIENLFIIN